MLTLTFLLVVFFCSTPINSALAAVVGTSVANIIVNLLLLFGLTIAIFRSRFKAVLPTALIYSLIAMLIMVTLILHPEYEPWYSHDYYGITRQFINLRGGIWALPIIASYQDDERLLEDLRLATLAVFIAYFGKFLVAMHRGYWIVTDLSGFERHAVYDMEFGYRMLFPVAFWGSQGFLNEKHSDLFLYFFGMIVILMGGSRGSIIWALVIPLLILPFKYRRLTPGQQKFAVAAGIPLIPILILLPIYAESLGSSLGKLMSMLGISSRTVDSLINGTLTESKGRSLIYSMAIDLIKTGGPFGRGFYGDRIYIGARFRWGYSHNVFLELLVSFGTIGGTLAIVALFAMVIWLYKAATTTTRQVIFITLLVASFKLLLSSSFWYEPTFWSLIGLSILWSSKPSREGAVAGAAHRSRATSRFRSK